MTAAAVERLRFLLRVVQREVALLESTRARLSPELFDVAQVARLLRDPDLSERVEAFVSRFARLQDTLGDKLLPAVLALHGEALRTVIDNLDRGEKLGWIESVQDWIEIRQLRNLMVHEYVEDPVVLVSALQRAGLFVPVLSATCQRLTAATHRRMPA